MSRVAEFPIEPQFLERWSSRAFSGAPLAETVLFQLLEAARWAPSSGNGQPWRFLYALGETTDFGRFHELLDEGNRIWCHRAGALLVVLSERTNDEGKERPTHSFDTGAAWMSFALQGSYLGLVVHGLGGFDRQRTRETLRVPERYAINCMIAVGTPGPVDALPQRLIEREKPSGRRAINSFSFVGNFPDEG